MTEAATTYRNRKPRFRTARRAALREQGITPPNRQQVWLVEPKALLTIPDSVLHLAVSGLKPPSGGVWLRPGTARLLIALDRAAGGKTRVMKTEFKRCGNCFRPLIGSEAALRRDAVITQGPLASCGRNCDRDKELKIWTK